MKGLINEIWGKFKPYFVCIVVDGLICCSLWCVLYAFKLLKGLFPIHGFVAELIGHIHSVGAVFSFVLFAYLFISDVRRIHNKELKVDSVL